MNERNWSDCSFLLLIIFVILAWQLSINIGLLSTEYFVWKFGDLMNVIVLGFLIYYYVEGKNDKRQVKQFLNQIVDKAINNLEDLRLLEIDDRNDFYNMNIVYRKIRNELWLLQKYSEKFGYENEAKYCDDELKKYWKIVSDYPDNKLAIFSNKQRLESYLSVVIYKLEKIQFLIYS